MGELVIDLTNDLKRKRAMLQRLNELRGTYRISVTKYRPRRSDRQNAFYWPCFVEPFAAWLRENGHEGNCEELSDLAHAVLKHKFLSVTAEDPETGAAVRVSTRSTTDLDTHEFNEYLDNCARWLAEFCAIEVPEPSVYRERDEQKGAA